MAWITPVTFTSSSFYNYSDLNRVENNIEEIKALITTLYSTAPTITSIVNRTTSSIEFYDSLNRIETNMLAMKNFTYEPTGWTTPKTTWKSLDKFDYVDANRLESNLLALYTMLIGSLGSTLITGADNATCGQDYSNL